MAAGSGGVSLVGVDTADLGSGVSSLLATSLLLSIDDSCGRDDGGRDLALSAAGSEGAESWCALDADEVRRGKGGWETGAGVFSRSLSSFFLGGNVGGGDTVFLSGRGDDIDDIGGNM